MSGYTHFARIEKVLDLDFEYKQPTPQPCAKPDGLWFSVPGSRDWPSWCEDEGFSLGDLAVGHEVKLKSNANILILSTVKQMDEFTVEYHTNLALAKFDARQYALHAGIDWGRVAKEYDGMIIAPWQPSRHHVYWWYNSWDCSSGCVWNLGAIESFAKKD